MWLFKLLLLLALLASWLPKDPARSSSVVSSMERYLTEVPEIEEEEEQESEELAA